MRAYFDHNAGQGFAYAYQLPGFNNVLQAGGRVIRGAKDVGVILLIDERFITPRYARCFLITGPTPRLATIPRN